MEDNAMERRTFMAVVSGGLLAAPFVSEAQQAAITRIGYLSTRSPAEAKYVTDAFIRGLNESGYVEGTNLAIEFRWAELQYDRLPTLASDLVRRRVAAIATMGSPAAPAAKAATATIPVVFGIGDDPVTLGLVTSLNRPGGNLTGVTVLSAELGPKRLELAHELVPTAAIVAVLVNPSNTNTEPLSRDLQSAARAIGLQIHVLQASTERDIDAAFATLLQLRAGALVIGTDPFFNSRSDQLAALALLNAMPTIFQFREFAAAGGVLSYGSNITDAYRWVGLYTGRILKGEKPADLPVQQSTKVELIINLKTAKALGLTVPLSLLGRADEVIE